MAEWMFWAGVDAAHGGSAKHKFSKQYEGDDFAMSVWRAKASGPAQLVKVIRHSGITDFQMSAIVHREHLKFGFTYIMLDPGGGGLFLMDHLKKPEQNDGSKEFRVQPIITIDDESLAGIGQPILVLVSRAESRIKGRDRDKRFPGVGIPLTTESVLPNTMHEKFRGALEASTPAVQFPKKWEQIENLGFTEPDDLRRWINEHKGLGEEELARAEIELALFQLVPIERVTDKDQVTPKTDKGGMYEFRSSNKKDAAYAVIMGYFGVWLWRHEQSISEQNKAKENGFMMLVDNI